jgi:hypothetical protein
MRYQDVKQDYVGVRGELGDLLSATANLILSQSPDHHQ